jgi:hypothetical protein
LWIGDATVIHAKRVLKQKTDRQDAQLILRLMLKDELPHWQSDKGLIRLKSGELSSCPSAFKTPGINRWILE